MDTVSGFECRCHYGFTGDGTKCNADGLAQTALAALYWTEPKGLSCKSGLPVPWPEYAPGWTYDPLKSFSFFASSGGEEKYGSKTNVTLEQCMAACQMAPTCESFVYNDILLKCFLNRAQCPVYNYCQGEQAKCLSTNDRGGQFEFDCGFWVSYFRLDSTAAASCQGFAYEGTGAANPTALEAWEVWRARNPTAPLRATPAELIAAVASGQPVAEILGDVQPPVVRATSGN